LTQRWPDPPRRNGIEILPPTSTAEALPSQQQPKQAQSVEPNAKDLIEIVLAAQERQAQTQHRSQLERIAWPENQLRSIQANSISPFQAPLAAPPVATIAPPAAIDLLGQVTKIIGEVDSLKAALGATAPSAQSDDSIGPMLREIIQSQLLKGKTNVPEQRQPADRSAIQPPPPLPERANMGMPHNGPLDQITDALKARIKTMAPEKLESILALVLDEDATIEDATDPDPQPNADPETL
jgi:hypothetical protein